MRGVGQAGTFRRTTLIPPRPSWAVEPRPITVREREAVNRIPDLHLTETLKAAGLSPFVARITVEDRHTAGAEWRIVQLLRKRGDL